MKLKDFIQKTPKEIDGELTDGIVDFDIGIYPLGKSDIIVDASGCPGLSRLKFQVKMQNGKSTNPNLIKG